MNTKLALGTAQFGLDYGIYNKKGRITEKEAFKILKYAIQNGIDVIDTAYAYGDSEKIIGQFIRNNKSKVKIISKVPLNDIQDVENVFNSSLKRLHSDNLYGYLVHNFNSFINNPGVWETLIKLKNQGKINKIGFSLYYPNEAEYILKKNIKVDILQVPFSIFDQRFSEIFSLLKENNVEIYVRSIFIQGLIFKNPDELQGKFVNIRDKLSCLKSLSKDIKVPISGICINFVLLNDFIDKVIIGVDSLGNLKENIKSINQKNEVKNIYSKLSRMKEDDEDIILPTKWK